MTDRSVKISAIRNFFFVISGVFLTAAAISLFYLPDKIVSGGVSGISTLLYHTAGIQPGVSNAVINVVLLAVGFKVLGRDFVWKTLACTVLLSGFMQMLAYFPPVTDDLFLASVIGSVLYGFGIGLTLVAGASTGGTDIVGRLIQSRFTQFPIGQLLLFVNVLIVAVSLVTFKSIELSLYGIVSLFVSSYAIDLLIKKLNVSKLAFVVSTDGEKIAKKLVSTSPRGVTLLDATGAYTGSGTKMLVCALKENEMPAFQKKILEIDSGAFIIFSESTQIVGNGFHVYK